MYQQCINHSGSGNWRTLLSLSVLLIPLVLSGGRALHAQSSNYREVTVSSGGIVCGSVRLACELPRKLQLAITKDANYCGVNKTLPRLRIGKDKGVQDAIVWLEGIAEGKVRRDADKQLVLDQLKCEYRPHILLLPFGSSLNIVNSDPILHNVHAYHDDKTLFNIAQPIKGQRTTVKQTQFKKPGLYSAACDAGHPWMSAYVMVSEHPYYALTDANGSFVLDNIPPGKYNLRMWHEGVAVVKKEMENGRPKAFRYEAPYEATKEVVVPANGKVEIEFPLSLRSTTPGPIEN